MISTNRSKASKMAAIIVAAILLLTVYNVNAAVLFYDYGGTNNTNCNGNWTTYSGVASDCKYIDTVKYGSQNAIQVTYSSGDRNAAMYNLDNATFPFWISALMYDDNSSSNFHHEVLVGQYGIYHNHLHRDTIHNPSCVNQYKYTKPNIGGENCTQVYKIPNDWVNMTFHFYNWTWVEYYINRTLVFNGSVQDVGSPRALDLSHWDNVGGGSTPAYYANVIMWTDESTPTPPTNTTTYNCTNITNTSFYSDGFWNTSLSNDLMTYLNFEQASGPFFDQSNNSRNASVGTAIFYDPNGKNGRGLNTSPIANSWVSLNHSVYDFNANISISFWIKTNQSLTTGGGFIYRDDNAGWDVFTISSTTPSCADVAGAFATSSWSGGAGGCTNTSSNSSYNDNQWHHVVYVTNGPSNHTIYVDGIRAGNGTNTVGTGHGTNIKINIETQGVYMHLDEFGVWNRTLTTSEVATLYNGGAGTFYNATVNYSIVTGNTCDTPTPSWVSPTPNNGTTSFTQEILNLSCGGYGNTSYIWFDQNTNPVSLVVNNNTITTWPTNVTAEGVYYYKGACWSDLGGFSSNTTTRYWYFSDLINYTFYLYNSTPISVPNVLNITTYWNYQTGMDIFYGGWKIQPLVNINNLNFTVYQNVSVDLWRIIYDNGTIVDSGTATTGQNSFKTTKTLYNNTIYRIEVNASTGRWYNYTNSSFPTTIGNILFIGGSYGGSDNPIAQYINAIYVNNTNGYNLVNTSTLINIVSSNHNVTTTISNGTFTTQLKVNNNYLVTLDNSNFALGYYNLTTPNSTTNQYQSYFLYPSNSLYINIYDEIRDQPIPDNMTVEVITDTYAVNYTATSPLLVSVITPTNMTIRYRNNNYVERDYYLTLTERSYNELILYDLTNGNSTAVVVTVKDTSGEAIENAIVKLLRYYVSCNCYRVVQMDKSNAVGETLFYVQSFTGHYKWIIEYNDNVVFISSTPEQIVDNTRSFIVDLGTNYYASFQRLGSITSSITYNNNTKVLSLTWNDPTNIVTRACVTAKRINGTKYTTEDTSCGTGSIGSTYIVLTHADTTKYLYSAYIDTNTAYSSHTLFSGIIEAFDEAAQTFGLLGVFLGIMVLVTLSIMFSSSATAVLVVNALGLVILTGLGLFAFTTSFIIIFVALIVGLVFYFMRT